MSEAKKSARKKKIQTRRRTARESGAAYVTDAPSPAKPARNPRAKKLVRELRGGKVYEYYLLGKFVVVAPDVAGMTPLFKYTRIRVKRALDLIADGATIEAVAQKFDNAFIPPAAIQEAIALARKAFARAHPPLRRVKRVI